MKISIVTISFNQEKFLERTIQSVISQTGVNIEYIICDPGSTDGSRDIIERYRPYFAHVIFDQDSGPADGLNRGFSYATGDIYCYLNSDDTLEPGALACAAQYFLSNPDVDVFCGHAWAIDSNDLRLRKVWSEPFRPLMIAHGMSIQIQPSTFIRRDAFTRSGGFNAENRLSWDGELLIDIFLSRGKIALLDRVLSNYRLHEFSITNSAKFNDQVIYYSERGFEKIMHRKKNRLDKLIAIFLRIYKHLSNPAALIERIRRGRVYGRGVK